MLEPRPVVQTPRRTMVRPPPPSSKSVAAAKPAGEWPPPRITGAEWRDPCVGVVDIFGRCPSQKPRAFTIQRPYFGQPGSRRISPRERGLAFGATAQRPTRRDLASARERLQRPRLACNRPAEERPSVAAAAPVWRAGVNRAGSMPGAPSDLPVGAPTHLTTRPASDGSALSRQSKVAGAAEPPQA